MRRPPNFLLAAASLALLLTGTEVTLARFLPFDDPFARFKSEDGGGSYIPSAHRPHYALTVALEKGLPGMQGTVVFATNNRGFRGDTLAELKPPGEFRIFLMGGSAAECMLLSDAQAIHGVLQDRLNQRWPRSRFRVYNAAKSGDKSYDHVALLTHRIIHLRPDLVVVLAGLNDLRAAVYGADYLHFSDSRATKYSLSTLLKFTATEFQTPRRLYALLHHQTEHERLEELRMVTDYRAKVALGAGVPVSDLAPRIDVAPYEANLRTIAGTARANGFKVVFMTQATTWNSREPEAAQWHWLTYLDGVRYREDLLDQALESYNDVVRRLGSERLAPVFDLARLLPKSLEFFYDDAHFNPRGAQTTGNLLADFLIENGLVPEAGKVPTSP